MISFHTNQPQITITILFLISKYSYKIVEIDIILSAQSSTCGPSVYFTQTWKCDEMKRSPSKALNMKKYDNHVRRLHDEKLQTFKLW